MNEVYTDAIKMKKIFKCFTEISLFEKENSFVNMRPGFLQFQIISIPGYGKRNSIDAKVQVVFYTITFIKLINMKEKASEMWNKVAQIETFHFN